MFYNLRLLPTAIKKSFFIFLLLSQTLTAYTKELTPNDSLLIRKQAQAEVSKAKRNKNWKQVVSGYKDLLFKSEKRFWPRYADSMVVASKQTNDNLVIGSAYSTKAIVYYDRKQLKIALDNFILADEYIAKTDNQYAIYKVKFGIAQTKYYLGYYDEAIALFKECVNYFEEENDRAYLNSLHALGLCYNRIGKYKECSAINKLGLEQGQKFENTEMASYFIHSEGVNEYFEHHYREAIKKLGQATPVMIANKDFANETVAYFYIGKSYWDLKNEKEAIPYFLKVDSAFTKHNYIRTDLRENYELLINYYKKQKNQTAQLQYINRLLKVDSVINHNYKYLSRKIHKEYDTKKLRIAKQDIQEAMNFRENMALIGIVAMAGLVLFLLVKNAKNKRRFQQLMKQDTLNTESKISNTDELELDINPKVILLILENLEIFEKEKLFIEKDMTIVKVATALKTNTKYASKVIVKYRNKKFIDYIRDLKVDYIVELLKKENKYRNYTNEALAEEGGFGTTQNFTRAFKSRTGISPSFFIQELKKSITTCD
jgi:tetratricopeptide (TPR) repeat protein